MVWRHVTASYHRQSGAPLRGPRIIREVMPNIKVMHFGLGPIGAAIVKQVATRPGFKIVGAIDIDPAKVGRDLGDVVGLPKRLGVEGVRRRGQGAQGGEARRRHPVHELVDQEA